MSRPVGARVEAATERLYALLPAHVRTVDAENGWALKALLQVLAGGSVEVDREIDALLESMFVETAPESALPELAALVASEPLRTLPAGSGVSTRAFIANTVRYRRGKGTARVLEQLSADVAGLGAVAVEYFQRLARLQHLVDVRAERPGTAMLVPGDTAARTGTAFDHLPRLLDVRSISRAAGRHHVTAIGVHLLRPVVRVYPAPLGSGLDPAVLAGVPVARPWTDGVTTHAGYFQLAAQPGRLLRLFNPDRRSRADQDRAVETDLPDRLRRLPLHLESEERRNAALEGRDAVLGEAPWFDDLGQPFTIFFRLAGAATFTRVDPATILIADLDVLPASAGARPAAARPHRWFEGGTPNAKVRQGDHEISCGFDPVTGRLIVATPAPGEPDVDEVRVAHATGIGREIGAGPQDRNADDVPFDITDTDGLVHFVRVVDETQPETGSPTAAVRPVRTLATALGEWATSGQGKRGLIILARCDREGSGAPIPVSIHPGSELHIVSGQWRPKVARPGLSDNLRRLGYLVRRDRSFTVEAPLRVTASVPPPPGARPGELVVDGLELTQGLSLGARAVSRLLIRHSTVRAPGKTAVATTAALDGTEVTIDRSIVGRVGLDFGTAAAAGSLVIGDSIVSADGAAGPAISATGLDARLRNVSVLGTSTFKSLEATNVILGGAATVARSQGGCVRFSWVPPGSVVPRRFRCQPDLAVALAGTTRSVPLTAAEVEAVALGVTPLFLDTSLDEPTVAMLHPLTRDAIRLGGEGDTEMGAFSAGAEGLRLANLVSLFDDYVPFGLDAGVIDDTRSSAVSLRRSRP